LKIDSHDGQSLPLDVLSRGTREAVFIALRLSLAAAYARRGVTLPLVLDDVLVNFDGARAMHAAKTLKTFAEMGHQVLMFTCHEHISKIFQEIDVQVRLLPAQGTPGRATILEPVKVYAPAVAVDMNEYQDEPTVEPMAEEMPIIEEVIAKLVVPVVSKPEPIEERPVVVQMEPFIRRPKERPQPPRMPQPAIDEYANEEFVNEEPAIDWNWYERGDEPWVDAIEPEPRPHVEGIWDRSVAWSDPNQIATK